MIRPLSLELLSIRLAALLTPGCLLLASASLLALNEKEPVAEGFKFKLPGSEKPVYQPLSGVSATRAQRQPMLPADPPEFVSPSLKEFPSALLHSFAGLLDSDNVNGPTVIGTWAAGAAILADESIKNYFESPRRAKAVGEIGDVLGNGFFLAGVTGALVAASYTGENQKLRAMSFSLAEGFVMSEIIVHSVKAATKRDRPSGQNQQSFPSGHTSATFTYATVISHYYGVRAGIPAFAVASLVGFSRIEKNKHHLSDVIAGATLGYLIGRTVVKVTDRRATRKSMTVTPLMGQETTGVSVRWTW